MVRVLQISDTHLSPTKRHFERNWEPLRDWVMQQGADLIIHTGDWTVDGADQEEDMRHCAALMRMLGAPVLSVPGNHDVGDPGNPAQPVNAERIARWRRHLGPDWWSQDVAGWRLIGLNAMLFGSGEALEAEQRAWAEQQMAAAGGLRIGWFLHRPLFLDSPREGDTGYWSVPPSARAPLLDLVRRYEVALVASGHLHKAHDYVHAGTRYIWGPAAGFVVGPALQPEMAGDSRLGAVLYEFEGAEVAAAIHDIAGLEALRIDDVLHEVYPSPEAA